MTQPGKVRPASQGPRLFRTNLDRSPMTHTIVGSSENDPNGDRATRARIGKFHQDFLCELVHFLRTPPTAPFERN